MNREEALTVAQLMEVLSKMPPDAPIYIEGCDCQDFADRVTTVPNDSDYEDARGAVWIRRRGGEDYYGDGPETWPAGRRETGDDDD